MQCRNSLATEDLLRSRLLLLIGYAKVKISFPQRPLVAACAPPLTLAERRMVIFTLRTLFGRHDN